MEDVRGAIDMVNGTDEKGEKMRQMLVALSILEAELLCEQGNWDAVDKAMEVG